ncbi:Smr/MutS family endonuclease [Methylonatrum kenyense]|uniref:Smr/MutS family protein n=1 Tax=Methylonatrum kenyense TaxID=455253 RepID=UPI0020BDED4D|nr:Smr/MutS family protein [Methylonatrum kenyense]MCK8516403.1 Smr/MutS family endonuclease [Methylonatrum kenyense]
MNDDDDEDRRLFQEAMADVRRLRDQRQVTGDWPRPKPVPQQRAADEAAVVRELLVHDIDPVTMETGEELYFARPGVQRRVMRKLRRGQYTVQDELDLHGMTVPVAREAVQQFIAESRAQDRRCVRIIHGKGHRSSNRGPVLKGKLDRWLRQWDEIIAFTSARPVDGGTGAVYVLLRA